MHLQYCLQWQSSQLKNIIHLETTKIKAMEQHLLRAKTRGFKFFIMGKKNQIIYRTLLEAYARADSTVKTNKGKQLLLTIQGLWTSNKDSGQYVLSKKMEVLFYVIFN